MAKITPNITEFIASLNGDGISKTDKFITKVNFPRYSGFIRGKNFTGDIFGSTATESLIYRCEMSEIPGRKLATVPYRTYGPDRKLAVHSEYDEITLTFVSNNFFSEKILFDQWQEIVQPSIDGWDLNYKKTYLGSVDIYQYDLTENIIYAVKCINAFPTNTERLNVNWSDENIHRLNVTFTYDYWELLNIGNSIGQTILQEMITGAR